VPEINYGIAVTVTRAGETVKPILFDGRVDVPDPAKAGAPTDTIPLHFDVPLDQIDGYAGRTAPINVSVKAEEAHNAISSGNQIVFETTIELNDLDLLDAAE
jgi:hypothetical protein